VPSDVDEGRFRSGLVARVLLALSRRFPLVRATWPKAVLVHAVALVAVLAPDVIA
jgi:hypothetical protein